MSKRVVVFVLLLLMPYVIITSYAHAGDTDGNGGHYNRTTGEYHYHHGYPAHSHACGKCPYDYDDQTGKNSGSSSNSSSTTSGGGYTAARSAVKREELVNEESEIGEIIGLAIFIVVVSGVSVGRRLKKKRKSKR